MGVIAFVILGVVFAKANVGMCAFLGAAILVLSGSADDGEAFKRMPWRVIVMVCGVTVLIALVERTQGIDLLVSLVARISSAQTVTGVVAFLTAVVSVYSSTSGVVLPAFLPMVPGLVTQLPGASAAGIAAAMNVGGHLVDRVAAIDARRALPGRRPIRGEPRALQQTARLGPLDGGRRRNPLLPDLLIPNP